MSGGPSNSDHPRPFATTHWSLVNAAARTEPTPETRMALETLCEIYWYPLYAYIRRKGTEPGDAQDLTQGFFVHLLEKGGLSVADQSRGRFRSFLLASLNHYMLNQWRYDRAQKRRSSGPILSIDFDDGEQKFRGEPSHNLTPERIFERRWAMTLVQQAVSQLEHEYDSQGKREQFELLKGYLGGGGGEDQAPYRILAESMGVSESAIKVSIHRMRKRCRELLRGAIAQTVDGPGEVDEELRELFQIVGDPSTD